MYQKIHRKTRTTFAIREEIQNSDEPISVLARRYNLSRKTGRKWKYSDAIEYKSSCPNPINITLTFI